MNGSLDTDTKPCLSPDQTCHDTAFLCNPPCFVPPGQDDSSSSTFQSIKVEVETTASSEITHSSNLNSSYNALRGDVVSVLIGRRGGQQIGLNGFLYVQSEGASVREEGAVLALLPEED